MRRLFYILIPCVVALCCQSLLYADNENASASDPRSEALRSLQQAADSGNPAACFHLARLYESGDRLVEADPRRALRLYTQAADSSYPPALNYLGYVRFNGMLGTEINPDTAIRLIERAAMLGDMSAAANLGWLLSQKGTDVKNDTEKAVYWLRKAARSGSYLPLEAIADIYRQQGQQVLEEAYLDSAALKGSVQAASRIMEIRANRYASMPADSLMKEALHYYHGGAPVLGIRMMEEMKGREDAEESDKALATAIEAQLTSQGLILPYDYERSLALFLKAAETGDPSAQYIVAETIDITPDAFKDVESSRPPLTASEWREAASRAGITDARSALSRLLP